MGDTLSDDDSDYPDIGLRKPAMTAPLETLIAEAARLKYDPSAGMAFDALAAEARRLAEEMERWKLQSDDWQKLGWELGIKLDDALTRATTAEARERLLRKALEELSECDFTPENCDTLSTASRRVRNVARTALAATGREE